MDRTSVRRLKLLFVVPVLALLVAAAAYGQTTTATIQGTVKDQSGAVLPGVGVKIQNTETGLTREVVTDDAGRYAAPQLPLGDFQVEASLEGFQTEVRTGIKLTVGREAVVDFALAIGEISERVQVTGDAPVVETTSSTIAGLVDDKKIRDLPLNGRSFSDLVTLQMGAVTQTQGARNTSSGFGLKISVSGARPSENSFLLDGNFVNDALNNTPSGATGLFLGVETLREFSVMTNTFSAEYGQSAGAVINAVTKSGTNQLHGSTFYFHRNSALDARNFFDRTKKPSFRRHQFGGVLGGPIVPNRTFFFGGYEGLREGLGLTAIGSTLTEDARRGLVYSPGQNPSQVTPIQIAPGVSDYFALMPLPNGRLSGLGTAEYAYSRTTVSDQNNMVVKIDHNFTDANSFFGRYTLDWGSVDNPGLVYSVFTKNRNQYTTLEEKSILSPEVLNIFRFGFNRSVLTATEHPLIDIPERLQLVPQAESALPEIGKGIIGSGLPSGIGSGVLTPRLYRFNLFETMDTLSKLTGRHSLKFGFNIKRVQANMISPQRTFGSILFDNITQFLTGRANSFSFVKPGSDVNRGIRFTVFGFFIQDDFQVRPGLTLNIGLRYEPSSIHKEVNGKISNLRNIDDAQMTVGDPLFENPTLKNFAPRIGIAWDPFGNGKTAVRAGFGIFYNIQMAEIDRATTTTNPPFTTVLQSTNIKFPFNLRQDLLSSATPPAPALDVIDFHAGQPYRVQYNLNVQREIFKNTSLIVGYVGARGIDLFRVYNWNQPDPSPSPDPARSRFYYPAGGRVKNPNFQAIAQRSTGADSYYHSIQMSLNKRFSAGFQAQGSYTFAKSLDTSSKQIRQVGESNNTVDQLNPLDTAAEKGFSEFDVKHNFSMNYTWELPGSKLTGPAGKVVGGWQLGGIVTVATGVPVTAKSGYDVCRCLQGLSLGSGGADNRADLKPGGDNNPILGGPDHYFDETQFIPGPLGFYGNVARNTIRIPGVTNVNFSLTKKTPFGEGREVQFRAELFNILNHANFGSPSTTLFQQNAATGVIVRNTAAGRITSTTTTARQIQFGLKVIF